MARAVVSQRISASKDTSTSLIHYICRALTGLSAGPVCPATNAFPPARLSLAEGSARQFCRSSSTSPVGLPCPNFLSQKPHSHVWWELGCPLYKPERALRLRQSKLPVKPLSRGHAFEAPPSDEAKHCRHSGGRAFLGPKGSGQMDLAF